MKKITLIFAVMVFAVLACQLPPSQDDSQPTAAQPQSQHRCGDGVCDGPENQKNCSQDCDSVPALESNTDGEGLSDESNSPEEPVPDSAEDLSASEAVLGEVFVEVQVSRTDGAGTCPSPPWGVDHIAGGDFSCPPAKYWYGYNLVATAHQIVQITPAGGGTWRITGEKLGGGAYQDAQHWSDGQRVCSPMSIEGSTFEFIIVGMYSNSQMELSMAADPVERSQWQCDQGHSYERETTLLLIDWALAMSGDYTDLSAQLRSTYNGWVRQTYTLDTNSSPEPRDHVEVVVDFTCLEEVGSDTYKQRVCPWEE